MRRVSVVIVVVDVVDVVVAGIHVWSPRCKRVSSRRVSARSRSRSRRRSIPHSASKDRHGRVRCIG